VDVSGFRVIDSEGLITAVLIFFFFQFLVKQKNIVHEIDGKFGHIFALSFSTQKFLPRNEQIFDGYDIIVDMMKLATLSLSLSRVIPRFCNESKRDI
jgi:hypothetical protein